MCKEFDNLGHDRMFKNLLHLFPEEYLQCFYPDFYFKIDWNRHVRLLSEGTDIPKLNIKENEPRYVDVLFEVYLIDEDKKTLLHFESQSYAQKKFPRRVYEYNCLVRSNHPDCSVYSFAICFKSYPCTGVRNRYEYNAVDGLEKNVFTFNEVHLKNFYWRDSSINHHSIIWALAPLMYRDNSEDDYEILVSCLQKVIESYCFLGTDKANMITLFLDYYFQPNDKIVEKIINELNENILEGDEEIMTSIPTQIQQISQVRAKSTMLKNAIQFRFFDGKAIPQYTLNLIESIQDGNKQEKVIGEIMSIKDNDPEIISKLNTYLQRNTV